MTTNKTTENSANKCAMLCELHILRHRGIERTEKEWEQQAMRQGWLAQEGIALYNIGRLLEQEGFSTTRTFHADMEAIRKALENQQDVIAVVDGNEMTKNVKVLDHEKLIDEYNGPNPNHAVVIKEYDPKTQQLVIFDPTKGLYTFSETLFKEAWDDSSNYLVIVSPKIS